MAGCNGVDSATFDAAAVPLVGDAVGCSGVPVGSLPGVGPGAAWVGCWGCSGVLLGCGEPGDTGCGCNGVLLGVGCGSTLGPVVASCDDCGTGTGGCAVSRSGVGSGVVEMSGSTAGRPDVPDSGGSS